MTLLISRRSTLGIRDSLHCVAPGKGADTQAKLD